MGKYDDLVAQHLSLQQQLNNEPDSVTLEQVKSFIEEVRVSGKEIGDGRQREELRAILRYWAAHVYDQTKEYPSARLASNASGVFSQPDPPPAEPSARRAPWWIWLALAALAAIVLWGLTFFFGQQQSDIIATAVAEIVVMTVTQPDSDNDGLLDSVEEALGTNPNNPDTDADGVSDQIEVEILGTDPNNIDSDGDGLDDNAEQSWGTNPLAKDSDGDMLTDGEEVYSLNTSPINPDTDGDGLNDIVDSAPLATPTPLPTDTPIAATVTPQPSSTPTAAPPTPTATATTLAVILVTVQPGDTFETLAERYETTVTHLMALNSRDTGGDALTIGETVRIPVTAVINMARGVVNEENHNKQVNLRSGPGTNAAIIGSLGSGDFGDVLARTDAWYFIRLDDGREGWVSNLLVDLISPTMPQDIPVYVTATPAP